LTSNNYNGKVLDLKILHADYPEIAITRDRKQVWVDDRLVWERED